jgi:hypothetical protein
MSDYLVPEIIINATSKAWSNAGPNGRANGTEVAFTVIPRTEGKRGWTPEEATIVAFEVRCEAQKFLLADAQTRGQTLPDQGIATLQEYQTRLKQLKSQAPELDSNWEEKTVQESEIANGSGTAEPNPGEAASS